MKKSVLVLLLSALLLLSACAPSQSGPSGEPENSATPAPQTLRVAATTYPVYLLTTAVTEGVEGVEVTLMLNQPTSCLHDYNLSSTDMKALEGADAVVLSGAGLEDFMSDALAGSDAAVIDSAQGIGLALYDDYEDDHDDHDHDDAHHDHDHEGEDDPHIWMDPARAAQMSGNIAEGLAALDGEHAALYRANAAAAQETLTKALEDWRQQLSPLSRRSIITFHDGFQYFASAFDLELLFAIEEEEGAEASAKEIGEISQLIRAGMEAGNAPAVFTEANGSDSTAKAVARETGVEPHQLTMIMSGSGTGLTPYLEGMDANIRAIVEALG